MDRDVSQRRLEQLRRHRNRPEPDLSLGFLKKQFQRDVARPHKQLEAWVEAWRELVPEALARHTRLDGFSRGVLRVSVDSSAHLYELDRLLRSGLERELIHRQRGHGTMLRRVQLRVSEGPLEGMAEG